MNPLLEMVIADPTLEYITCDAQFAITSYSRSAFKLLVGADVSPTTLATVLTQDIRDWIPELVGLEETIAELWQQQRQSFELKGVQRDGRRFIDLILLCESSTIISVEAPQIVVLIRDVSDRMNAEQRLSQVAKEYNLAVQELSTAQAYLKQIMECMGDALLVTNTQGKIKQLNPATLALFEYDRDDLLGQPITILLAQRDTGSASDWLDIWQNRNYEQSCCTRTGRSLIIAFSCTPLVNQLTEEREFVCIGRDMTLRKRMEQQLQSQLSAYQLLNQMTQHLRYSLSLEDTFQRTAQMLQQWLLCDRVLIVQWQSNSEIKLHTLLTLDDEVSFTPQAVSLTFNDNPLTILQHQLCLPDVLSELTLPLYQKRIFWGAIAVHYCHEIHEWESQEIHILEQVSSQLSMAIAQLKLYEQLETTNLELRELAEKDHLTQVATRRAFDWELQKAWHKSIVSGESLSLLIIYVDFSQLPTTHSCATLRDNYLCTIAQMLTPLSQTVNGLLARYEAEEFVLLVPLAAEELPQFAQQCQAAIAQQLRQREDLPLSPNIHLNLGGATFDPTYRSWQPKEFLSYADQALKAAQQQGQNHSYFWIA